MIEWKRALLARAAGRFARDEGGAKALRAEFEAWRQAHAEWVEDLALFLALKDAHGGAPWVEWDAPLRRREGAAIAAARARHAEAVDTHVFRQWAFFRQWDALRAHAAGRPGAPKSPLHAP